MSAATALLSQRIQRPPIQSLQRQGIENLYAQAIDVIAVATIAGRLTERHAQRLGYVATTAWFRNNVSILCRLIDKWK